MTFFDQIFTLLTTSPGNLIYHLALMFSITGTLYMAIAQWRSTGYPQVRRMLNGLLLLLAGQIVLFIASALVWQRLVDAEVLAWGREIRQQIEQLKLRRVMSTRVMIAFSEQKANLDFVQADWELSYFADWTKDEMRKIGRAQ